MDLVLRDKLKKMGAIACAANKPILKNPFLIPEACPGATGESVNDWIEKVDAWDSGWNLQKVALAGDELHMKAEELPEAQQLKGMFGEAKRAVSIEEMNAAIAAAAARAGR